MKLLKACFKHWTMFEKGWASIDLFAEDRVPPSDESVHPIKRPVHTNSVVALAGINASGKTTVLSLLELVINTLNGQPLASATSEEALLRRLRSGLELRAVFVHGSSLYVLESEVDVASWPNLRRWEDTLSFTREVLYRWRGISMPKKSLFSDTDALIRGCDVHMRRDELDKRQMSLLSHNVSIAKAVTDGGVLCSYQSALDERPAVDVGFSALPETMRVFDPSIASLEMQADGRSCILMFENGPVVHTTVDLLDRYLSAGTEKGLRFVNDAIRTLSGGGYLLTDEIENHLNKQLVGIIIDLFQSRETNPRGATLVFTTHYPEILDRIHRKDNVYFLSRGGDRHLFRITKYSSQVKRIENKKSEVFLSNYLGGTAPRYSSVQELRALVRETVDNART